jgi:hypothetical protein
MFAALPMYDRPDNRAAHDRLWGAIRDGLKERGVEAPEALDRETYYSDGWARPDLQPALSGAFQGQGKADRCVGLRA